MQGEPHGVFQDWRSGYLRWDKEHGRQWDCMMLERRQGALNARATRMEFVLGTSVVFKEAKGFN